MAGEHGAHASCESSKNNHRDVNEQEQHQKIRGEEMQGARRLLAAKDGHEYREHRDDGRRHGEAGDDHEGEQQENYRDVGNSLIKCR